MKRVVPVPMNNSKIHEAKLVPACGRALGGELLIETSTAGNSSIEGSATRSPVNGLTPAGNCSRSGPRTTGVRRGWGVAVTVGGTVVVGDGGAVSVAMAAITVAVGGGNDRGGTAGAQPKLHSAVKTNSRENFFICPLKVLGGFDTCPGGRCQGTAAG